MTDYEKQYSPKPSRSECKGLSFGKQHEAAGVNRTSQYYQPKENTPSDEELNASASSIVSTRTILPGRKALWPRTSAALSGIRPDDARQLYMREMGIDAIYPKMNLSKLTRISAGDSHLLKHVDVQHLTRHGPSTSPTFPWSTVSFI